MKDIRYWHLADNLIAPRNVAFGGKADMNHELATRFVLSLRQSHMVQEAEGD